MYYVNGEYFDEASAKISVLDLGLVRGYGVFDFLRTYSKQPFHLWDHLLRLKYSSEHIGLKLPQSLEEIQKIVETLLDKSPYPESSVKIIVTGGISSDQLLPQDNSSLIIYVYPFSPYAAVHYQNGIKAFTTTLNRVVPKSKTLQYIPAIIALQASKAQNGQEALYLSKQNHILEGTTSNFFAFKKGVLITPYSDELLLGITREVVLRLAKECFPLEIRNITYDEINEMDEAFLTSSTREIVPVTQIDNLIIGDGKVGTHTKLLMHHFSAYTKQPYWDVLGIKRYGKYERSDLTLPLPS